jgi:long-chain acyl-CoA synthetase
MSRDTDLTFAPRVVFDALPEMASRPRFMVPEGKGRWRVVTWADFASRIRRAACFLAERGLRMGDRACIFAPNSVDWGAAALAIQAAGGVMVPIYASNTAEQMAYVVDHSDAEFVFVDSAPLLERALEACANTPKVKHIVYLGPEADIAAAAKRAAPRMRSIDETMGLFARVLPWDRALAEGQLADDLRPARFEERMSGLTLDGAGVMLYTSGTSGPPKGVPLTHRNVGTNGVDWLAIYGAAVPASAVDLLWLPMSHIFGFGELCLGNTLRFTTYMSDPKSLYDHLKEVRPQVFMSVPQVWEKLASVAAAGATAEERKARLAEVSGGAIAFGLSGGAGLKREVKELFRDTAGLAIMEGYGLTECSPTLTLNRPEAYRFDSVGKVLPSVELALAEDGEILARGPSVFRGYHKDEAATREAFTADGWFKTGDIGRFTDDGFLQIVDRKKDILVTAGGKNVAPANIEQLFASDDLIAHAVVYGEGKKYLVAGFWLNPPGLAAAEPEELAGLEGQARVDAARRFVQAKVDAANEKVAHHETIKAFRIFEKPLTIEAGFLTPTLKIRRKAIVSAFRADFEGLYT